MPDFKPQQVRGRSHGLQAPSNLRKGSPGAPQNLELHVIAGIPHVWDPDEGVLVNLESVSEKIDPQDWRANR